MPLTANAASTDRYRLRTVDLRDPGFATPAIHGVGPNEVIQIVGVCLQLSTGVAVQDRRVHMFILDTLGANPIQISVSAVVQTASLTWTYWFSCGIAPVDDSHSLRVFDPLACGLQLYELERFSVSAFNLHAGDVIHDVSLRLYQWKMN